MIHNFKKLYFVIYFVIVLSCFSRGAEAHPHIWVDTQLQFIFSSQKLTHIQISYAFDEMYSSMILNLVDRNDNGTIDLAELDGIKNKVLAKIDDKNYFVHLRVNKNSISSSNIELSTVLINEEERLVLVFIVPCQIVVTESMQIVAISAYDEEYYYEIMNPMKEAIFVKSEDQLKYSILFEEDNENAYYFDQFNPVYTEIHFKKI